MCHDVAQMATTIVGMAFDSRRFSFIADALDGDGGFSPIVRWEKDTTGLDKPASVDGVCYLVPHPRETLKKYAARCAVAVYENHLRSACERFVGYLAKRPPLRSGVDGPLAQRFLEDADWRGNSLDIFWQSFAIQAKARGSMLLLVDMQREQDAASLADQVTRRALPYLVPIAPERVTGYELNDQGLFDWVEISALHKVGNRYETVTRRWDARTWSVRIGNQVVDEGEHGFGQCPVLIFSESGEFPFVGGFEQVAQLSRRLYNARSELQELIRGQTFSVLVYQVRPEDVANFNGSQVVAELGVNNMLIHSGDAPSFIAPDVGQAKTIMDEIAQIEAAIRRIGMVVEEPDRAAAESGVALAIRFEALNSSLSAFARRMEDLERRVWSLFARVTGQRDRASIAWSKDFSLADVQRELDVLAAMQSTGFPDLVLREKRKAIVAADFPTLDDNAKGELVAAIDESASEVPAAGGV